MNTIEKQIRLSGGRLTKIKKAIISVLSHDHCLLSKNEIALALKKQKINPNRSTLYRELQSLTKNGVVARNNILGVEYYEIAEKGHYHLICMGCKKIGQIEIDNLFKKRKVADARKTGFSIINHSLEFYGYCRKCQA